MTKRYKAAVIGLGRIGSSYPSIGIPRTHAGAYESNLRTRLAAGVDIDKRGRMAFSERWGRDIPVFSALEEMLSEIQPDVISVCVSPSILPSIIDVCMKSSFPPRVFFLEKPIVMNDESAHRLVTSINNIPCAVNYHRCWDPAHKRLFKQLLSSQILGVKVFYTNGMFNYASHLLALLIHYFGVVTDVKKLSIDTYDSSSLDPSFSFILNFSAGIKSVFQGFDNLPYDLLELEIVTDSGIYSLKSSGCRRRIEMPVEGVFYAGYKQLVDAPYSEPDSQVEGLTQAIDNIVDFLDGSVRDFACDLSLGLNVFDTLSQVKKLYHTQVGRNDV